MRAEERRADRDRTLIGEAARDAQRLALGGKVEPVAGLDFDRRDAFGDQRVEPPQRRAQEFVFARRARRAHGRKDAAALAGDLFVARAGEPQLEFVRPVAAVDEVGVAVDQRRA